MLAPRSKRSSVISGNPFLDPPARWARKILHWSGIPPGIAVFTAEVNKVQDAKVVAHCFSVRVVARDGQVRQIYPPGGVCPPRPPRMWVTGEQIALYRSATSLRAAAADRRAGILPPSRIRHPELLLESIADYFRAKTRAEGVEAERYVLLWTELSVDYNTIFQL